MKKIFTTFLLFFIVAQATCQSQRKISTMLFAQYNHTLYDVTLGNNPSGAGFALQTFFNNRTKFKPTIELTGSIYLEDDKVLRLNSDGTIPTTYNDVRGMVNLFAGSSFHPSKNIYLSFLAGPAFINGQTYMGIKPSFGFYFSKNEKWAAKFSFVNIFNRDKVTKQDFGSLAFGVGLKLF